MKGFILFSVLLFLQIFSLLGLYGVTAVKSMLRNSNDDWRRQMNKVFSTHILQEVENHLLFHVPLCIIPTISASLLASNSDEWWKAHACHGNVAKNRYDYVVELLGKDSCSLINKHDIYQAMTAEYYRISLLFLPSNIKEGKILWQSVIVKANADMTTCKDKWHQVALGPQMRHELIGRKKN